MPAALVWRLVAADGWGVPFRDHRAKGVVIGSTEELGDGDVCVWFRVLPGAGPDPGKPGDRLSRDRVVVEVRDPRRARERVETATGMYLALKWVIVEDPREIDVPEPPLSREDIMSGVPLQEWAAGVVEQFMARP